MKKASVFRVVWMALGLVLACSPTVVANFDRSRISPYTLEDPLVFVDGRRVNTPAQWEHRRQEILSIFAREMYGRVPPEPEVLVTELANEKASAGGKAILRQYRMWFTKDRRGPCVNWIVFSPVAAEVETPVILFLNYKGNHELTRDPDVPVMTAWSRNGGGVENNRISPLTRGCMADPKSDWHFPLEMILDRGYAVMSACYCEISPDPNRDQDEPNVRFRQDVFAYTGIFELWGKRDPDRSDDITALGAWAWVLSRGLDLAARVPGIDIRRSVVTGCSRLGKVALLAAARDERFAVCVPVQTGGGGCPLAKRDFGEDIASENVNFTHWYCKAYRKYSREPWKTMPFDQHLLLASIAPRALLVQGFNMDWFDPEGEFLACQAAAPVWKFLGRETMPDVPYPQTGSKTAIGRHLGFVRRDGGHGINLDDWQRLLDFSDRVFRGKAVRE